MVGGQVEGNESIFLQCILDTEKVVIAELPSEGDAFTGSLSQGFCVLTKS